MAVKKGLIGLWFQVVLCWLEEFVTNGSDDVVQGFLEAVKVAVNETRLVKFGWI